MPKEQATLVSPLELADRGLVQIVDRERILEVSYPENERVAHLTVGVDP
jgi:hypothetical protein